MVFSSFANKASCWPNRIRLRHTKPGEVKVPWVPSHAGILGNTLADTAAKEALSMPPPISFSLSLDSAKAWIKKSSSVALKEYWEIHSPQSYRDLQIGISETCPAELSLPRSLIAHIFASSSGHGDFATYHERFNYDNAYLYCSCGDRKSPKHI
ncbi:hypothetical protein K3495_g5710 [Podosphaera aphanis]|nr:hypothetical protein K3495_g5710 [Podosphaera aphanis]